MKEQPYSLQAEKAVLGSMLISKDALYEAVSRLTVDDFYNRDNKIVFDAACKAYKRGINVEPVTVIDQLALENTLNDLSDIDYVNQLADEVVSASNIEEYVKIVKDKSLLRELVNFAESVATGWQKEEISDIGDYANNVEEKMLSITRSRSVGEFRKTRDVLNVLREKIISHDKHQGVVTGTTTGYHKLDLMTHGFQKGDLVILAARPSMGKTALALNFATNAAKSGVPVAIFSLEMPDEQLIQRMLSATSGVDSDKIRSYNMNEKDWAKLETGIKKLSESEIYIDDTASANIGDIKTKANKLKKQCDNLGLIVVDYLQLITPTTRNTKDSSRQLEVSEITRALKAMARDLKVPVLALSQLSRSIEKREDKTPMLSDLRESGTIEQEADIVMFINREDFYNRGKKDENSDGKDENVSMTDVIIAKQRNGSIGSVKLVFLKNIGLFGDYSERED